MPGLVVRSGMVQRAFAAFVFLAWQYMVSIVVTNLKSLKSVCKAADNQIADI